MLHLYSLTLLEKYYRKLVSNRQHSFINLKTMATKYDIARWRNPDIYALEHAQANIPVGAEQIYDDLDLTYYRKESTYRIQDADGDFLGNIGQGLFRIYPIAKNQLVAQFKGELIDFDEVERRDHAGEGGYSIQIQNNLVLDSFTH